MSRPISVESKIDGEIACILRNWNFTYTRIGKILNCTRQWAEYIVKREQNIQRLSMVGGGE